MSEIAVVEIKAGQKQIEFDLWGFPSVNVLHSHMTEAGWLYMLEGDVNDFSELFYDWEEAGWILSLDFEDVKELI